MPLSEHDAGKPSKELFDESALTVVGIMAEELIGCLFRMEKRLVNRFGDTVPGQDAMSTVSMQVIISMLCSYVQAAFDGEVSAKTVARRLVRTWNEMEQGSALAELREKAEKTGLS